MSCPTSGVCSPSVGFVHKGRQGKLFRVEGLGLRAFSRYIAFEYGGYFGLYTYDGKENGNYYLGFRGYIVPLK